MSESLKRISVMIKEEQHERLSQEGINLSGLLRDLLDDFLSDHKITISVTENTKRLYSQIISSTGASDEDLEPFLKEALGHFLRERVKSIKALEDKLLKE